MGREWTAAELETASVEIWDSIRVGGKVRCDTPYSRAAAKLLLDARAERDEEWAKLHEALEDLDKALGDRNELRRQLERMDAELNLALVMVKRAKAEAGVYAKQRDEAREMLRKEAPEPEDSITDDTADEVRTIRP